MKLKRWLSVLFIGMSFLLASGTANATMYYVSSTGNDDNTGTSVGASWRTVAKVNSTVNTNGDDVYFECGASWKEALKVDWGGVDNANRTVISSYYGATPIISDCASGGFEKPQLVGAYGDDPSLYGIMTGAIPVGWYTGLIHVQKSYVTVSDMWVYNSSNAQIYIDGTDSGNQADFVIIENNIAQDACGQGIIAKRFTDRIIIRNNQQSGGALCVRDGVWKKVNNHPVVNGFVESDQGIFESNIIHGNYGENITTFEGATYNIIRDNTVFCSNWTYFQTDASRNNVWERNVAIGCSDPEFLETGGYARHAFNINVENNGVGGNSTGNLIRNNIIVGFNACLNITMQKNARSLLRQVGFDFLGNTCVGNNYTFRSSFLTNALIEPSTIKNNIFTENASDCFVVPGGTESAIDNTVNLSEIDANYNHWDLGANVTANTISFTNATNTIDDSANGFGSFASGMAIRVSGTVSNNGIYTTSSATAGSIIVNETLVDESAGGSFTIEQTTDDLDCVGLNDVNGDPLLSNIDWVNQSGAITNSWVSPQAGSGALDAGVDIFSTALTAGDYPQTSDLLDSVLDLTYLSTDFLKNARVTTTMGALEGAISEPVEISVFPAKYEAGTGADVVVASGTWKQEDYRDADTSNTNNTTNTIIGTVDQDLHNTWRQCNCDVTYQIRLPNGNYDFTFTGQEPYHGIAANSGICDYSGSYRTFDYQVQDKPRVSGFNYCSIAGAPNKLVTTVVSNVNVTDNYLTFKLFKVGDAGKPLWTSWKVTTAAPTGNTITVNNPNISISRDNINGNDIYIDPVVLCQVNSTAVDPLYISSITTTGLTSGSATIDPDDNSLLIYYPASGSTFGNVGSITSITFADGEDTDTCDIDDLTLTQVAIGTISFTAQAHNGTGRVKMTSQTGINYWLINLSRDAVPIDGIDETTDVNGVFEYSAENVIPGDNYRAVLMIPGWSTFGTNTTHNRIHTREFTAQ